MSDLRQYLLLMARRRPFAIGLGIVLFVAVMCDIAAHTNLVWNIGQDGERGLVGGFGDALIIAFILALLVDPAAQHKFAMEWGRDLYWAIFSPDSPQEFRDALQALAAPLGYISCCTYEVDFNDLNHGAGSSLQVHARVKLSGVTLDRRGFRPSDRVSVTSGFGGARSHYCYWSFEGADTPREEYSEKEMEGLHAVSQDQGGRTVLDQSLLTGEGTRVPFRGTYKAERHVRYTFERSGYIPLAQGQITLKQIVVIKGNAINDLHFTLIRLGRAQTPDVPETRMQPDGRTEIFFDNEKVAFPGQASILSWRPKTAAEILT